MKLEIMPGKSLGRISLGMSKAEIRGILAGPVTSGKQNEYALRESDSFDLSGIKIDYDGEGRCEAIEARRPSDPVFQGNSLIGVPRSRAQALISRLDPMMEIELGCIIWRKLGLTLYFELNDKEEIVETVTVFVQGYYEQYSL